ncbi:MAG: SdpI family protein [Bacteroidetes bacterium]|nr:SdpI family protein [Bacteroidota bacterium]MBS1631748.1 SdpI family protein [Bacteroidota bacterium]
MKHTVRLRWIFILLLLCIPWIYLATIWGSLPERIPVHFGISGAPDQYGNKSQLLFINSIMTAVAVLLYLLITNIHKIDPKRYARKQQDIFMKIGIAVTVLMVCINIFILHFTFKQYAGNLSFFFVLMGIFFAYLGNLMHSIKPNYFAGFRLPWTLESEANWKATHQFVSKFWFIGGIAIALLAILIKPAIMIFVMMGIILIMVIIPVFYSYQFFKKEKAGLKQ